MKVQFLRLSLIVALACSGSVFALPGPGIRNHKDNKRGLVFDILPVLHNILSLDILGDMITGFDLNPSIRETFPDLRNALVKAKAQTITPEELCRALLRSIQAHDVYKAGFDALEPDQQEKINRFLDGEAPTAIVKKRSDFYIPPSPAAKHHFKRMEEAGTTASARAWLNAKRGESPVIYEDEQEKKVMKVHIDVPFENWGLTVKNTPAYTFVPTTVLGIQNLVRFAKTNNKRVRGSGYRHTWTSLYSEENEILVSMLDLKIATAVPDPSSLLPNANHEGNELKVIEPLDQAIQGSEGQKKLIRVGAAVTNEELRRWAIHNGKWTLPVNVIMVEITLGGSNTPICHGAGLGHRAISDYVREVEYVDAHGEVRSVSDPELLKAAAGSFGLLGIITHITFEFDKMTYAMMTPKKVPVHLGIPPPLDYYKTGKIPLPLRKVYTEAELETARRNFEHRVKYDYYNEWFWFPFQKEVFVNCWNNTNNSVGVTDYPSPPDVFLQWVQGWIGGIINDSPLFRALPGVWQAFLLGTVAHIAQPPIGPINENILTSLPDALHFRRGVQNMRVRDLELQIPIPARKDDPTKPDYSVIQKAWWDAIIESYVDPEAPMRIALELRVMGDSQMIMAAQHGNKFGTASIEVLSTMAAVDDGSWLPYAQRVADKWMGLQDQNGNLLKTRPHWAKEWDGMKVNGKPWKEYLKTNSYKDEIPIFKSLLAVIGQQQGWTVADARARFSNPLLDYIIFEE